MVARDSVALTGSVIGLFSLPLGWLTLKPSRVAAGTGLSLWEGIGWDGAAIILGLWLICLTLSLMGKRRWRAPTLGVTANIILTTAFIWVGLAADKLLEGEASYARVSLGAGVWLTLAGAYVVIFAARQKTL